MEEFFAIGMPFFGMALGAWAIYMDYKKKAAQQVQNQQINQIITADNLPLDEVVRTVLKMQLESQKSGKRMERVIGFLLGIASSTIVSIVFLYLAKFI